MSSDEPHHDPDLEAGLRAEERAERRATEHEALRDLWARRRVIDVLHEALRRGDHLTVHAYPRQLSGPIVEAGRDFAVIATTRQRVTVRASIPDGDTPREVYQQPPLHIEVAERAQSGGRKPSQPTSTFRSVLQRFDFQAQIHADPVEVGVLGRPDPLVGSLRALGHDHLYLSNPDEVETFIALSAVTYIAWADFG